MKTFFNFKNKVMFMSIPNVKLKNGVEMPILGLGTWQLTGKTCERAVKDAISLGYTHIDTAEFYGNHKEIGKAIKNADRKKLFITSKVWYDNLKYDDVIKACDKTLEDLETSYLDLYLIHWPNKKIDMTETFKALKKLYDDKKIRAVGVSNFTINHIEEALKISEVPITVNQVEFHPYLYQKELLDYCNSKEIVLTAYSPLARGKVFNEKKMSEISKKYHKTPGQITLRWMVQKNIVVIPKASSIDHLKSNMAIFDFNITDNENIMIEALNKNERMINPSFAEFFLNVGYSIKSLFRKK